MDCFGLGSFISLVGKLGRKKEVFFVKRGLDKSVFYGIIALLSGMINSE